MKFGARNQVIGKVESIKKGPVMCEVKLKRAVAQIVFAKMLRDVYIKRQQINGAEPL